MKRFKIVVAYDGTEYCGWQMQPNGITIEQVLNETLSRILREDICIIGASRTDSGVHALGNVAVFDSNTSIPSDKICYAINPHLPPDIRIVESSQVLDDFHPRYCPTRKIYEYHIQNSKIIFPTKRLYAHHISYPLDVEAMEKAGQYLVGTYDFKSFCASKTQAKTTVRTVNKIRILDQGIPVSEKEANLKKKTNLKTEIDFEEERNSEEKKNIRRKRCLAEDREIIIEVTGEGFLYNMVRIISGTLIKVGLHVYPPEHVKEILLGCERSLAGETVPAKGLLLKKIEYL